jgi:hypothetical protein
MATPSKRHVNWTATTWVQTAPSSLTSTITGVLSVQVNRNLQSIQHSGDADFYPTLVATVGGQPSLSISHRDLGVSNAIPDTSRGTLSAKHSDAKNGITASSGGYTVQLVGVVSSNDSEGAHRQFGGGTITVIGESTDGTTSPLSFTSL